MDTLDDRYTLSALRGEFVDVATENAFREHIRPTMVRHLRTALFVWAFVLVSFGAQDYQALGWSEGFIHLMGGRVLQACLLLTLAWRLYARPELATSAYAVTALEVFGFLLFFGLYYVRPEVTTWTIGVTLIVLISMFIFIPSRAVPTLAAALFGIVGTLYALHVRGSSAGSLVALSIILLFPTIIGYVAGLRLQKVQRQQFALLSQVTDANKALGEEISRREELEIELKRQATTDPLTGLFNRRQYELLFERERQRNRRHDYHLSLCVVDLDHFKQVNDKYGHDLGDKVLQFVSKLLLDTLRQSDIVGRFGGEEFILLLPDTNIEQAVVVVNRVRQKLESSPLVAGGTIINLTGTFGVTQVTEADAQIEDVIRRADKALYDGKNAGRNQVVAANG